MGEKNFIFSLNQVMLKHCTNTQQHLHIVCVWKSLPRIQGRSKRMFSVYLPNVIIDSGIFPLLLFLFSKLEGVSHISLGSKGKEPSCKVFRMTHPIFSAQQRMNGPFNPLSSFRTMAADGWLVIPDQGGPPPWARQ